MTDPDDDPWAGHSSLLGRVAIDWGNAHFMVYMAFLLLSGMPDDCAEAVFFALRADNAQRDITVALAKVRLKDRRDLLHSLCTPINKLDGLSNKRNAVVHTLWAMHHPEYKVTHNPMVPRHSGWKSDDFEGEISKLRREIYQCYMDLTEVYQKLPRP